MAVRKINIQVVNTALGSPSISVGICGLVIKAVAVTNKFALGTAYLISQKSDLDTLGINAAYDKTNKVAVYQQVSEFYDQAGDGAYLYLLGVDKSTAYATYVAGDDFKAFIRATYQTDFFLGIKNLGIGYAPPTATQTSADFPSDVTATITALHATRQSLYNEGYRFNCILDGYNMDNERVIGSLANLGALGKFSISLCVAGSKPNGVSSIGNALGKYARISVGRDIGAVEDGSLAISNAFLTDGIMYEAGDTMVIGQICTVFSGSVTYNSVVYATGENFTVVTDHLTFTTSDDGNVYTDSTKIDTLTPTEIETLGSKQYFFLRTWQGKSGYYWNDGATCDLATNAFGTYAFNRVANYLADAASIDFTNEIGKNLPVDKSDSLSPAYCAAKQTEFKNARITPLINTSDISDADITITGANFNANRTMNFTLRIVGAPGNDKVVGVIEFVNKL